MKQKSKTVLLYCLVLSILPLTGCFTIMENWLGTKTKPKEEDGPGTITFTQGPRYTIRRQLPVVSYHYQYLVPNWWYRWSYSTDGRCWWLDYNYTPADWPRPKLEPVIERRTMIPRDTKGGIDRYVDSGVPTGSFLRAVLSNDLFEAVARADADNKLALATICEYICYYTPTTCHGSPEEVAAWIKYHRENPEEANCVAGMDRERREAYYELERHDEY